MNICSEAPYLGFDEPAAACRVTVAIPCRGRLVQLKQAVRAWQAQDVPDCVDYRILVLDYGCPERTFDWVWAQHPAHLNLDAARLIDEHPIGYHYTRARNLSGRACRDGWIIFTDADLIVHDKTIVDQAWHRCCERALQTLRIRAGASRIPFPLMIRRDSWARLGGFCESMPGWGHEDIEFWFRAMDQGAYETLALPTDAITHLPLPRGVPDKKQRPASGEHNLDVFRKVTRRELEINPNGFGHGRLEAFSGLTGTSHAVLDG